MEAAPNAHDEGRQLDVEYNCEVLQHLAPTLATDCLHSCRGHQKACEPEPELCRRTTMRAMLRRRCFHALSE